MHLSSAQVRAARALLGMSAAELAERTGLAVMTINKFENGVHKHAQTSTMELLEKALSAAGAEFLPGEGVRKRDDLLRTFDGPDAYIDILDDAFKALQGGGEMLFAFVSNRRSGKEVIASQQRLRACGVRFRMLISEEDDYCHFPLREYRCIPKERFRNNTQVIYGNRVATMLTDGDRKRGVVIDNAVFAETQRSFFEMAWQSNPQPNATSAKVIYD